jgi:hypothetical protein
VREGDIMTDDDKRAAFLKELKDLLVKNDVSIEVIERSAGSYNGFGVAGIEFFNRDWTIEIESRIVDSHDIEKAIEG